MNKNAEKPGLIGRILEGVLITVIGGVLVVLITNGSLKRNSTSENGSEVASSPTFSSAQTAGPDVGTTDVSATYSDSSWLSVNIVHFPNVEQNDYVTGGVWSLPYDLVENSSTDCRGEAILYMKNNNSVVWRGHLQFGTVWSEDDQGNWEEKPEDFTCPYTEKLVPKETYGTFVVVGDDNINNGVYVLVIEISLDGVVYKSDATITIP